MGVRKKRYNADRSHTYMFTRKEHELFGPFSNIAVAHQWAKTMKIRSYVLLSDRVRVEKLRNHIINAPYLRSGKAYDYDGNPLR